MTVTVPAVLMGSTIAVTVSCLNVSGFRGEQKDDGVDPDWQKPSIGTLARKPTIRMLTFFMSHRRQPDCIGPIVDENASISNSRGFGSCEVLLRKGEGRIDAWVRMGSIPKMPWSPTRSMSGAT